MKRPSLIQICFLFLLCVGLAGWITQASALSLPESLTPQEAQQIAQEAYVYAYPMLEAYRTMLITLDKLSPKFWAPLNHFYHVPYLSTPAYTTVILTNNDTLYSRAWLDLRTEPIVLSVPAFPKERYYSIMFNDMFTHNFAYVGTRTNGNAAGNYLIAGPNWQGTTPVGINAVIRSDSNFIILFGRTLQYSPDDWAKASALQHQYQLTPLSTFLGEPAKPQLPLPPYPSQRLIFWLAARWYDAIGPGRGSAADALGIPEEESSAAGFITYFNFLLGQVRQSPTEQELLARFARIGIGPDRPFALEALEPAIRKAIERGVTAGYEQIRNYFPHLADTSRNGWYLPYTIFGTREQMQGRYLTRAAAAMFGIYGNSFEEAYYPYTNIDATGQLIDGSKHSYVIKFRKEDLPHAKGFWSLTPYYWPQETLVSNPIQRYSLGDRTPGVKYDADGSLTIYLQFLSPGEDKEANWLPIPNGPTFLLWRLYWSDGPVDRQWAAPPVTVVPPGLDFRSPRSL